MASISIADSKFACYRNDLSDGSSPYTEILAATDGAGCLLKDDIGKVWCFRVNDAKLEYKRSTDTEGLTLDDDTWHEVVGSLVKDGIPTAIELPTGRIMVSYWKDDDKWYSSYTDGYGDLWTETEVTT